MAFKTREIGLFSYSTPQEMYQDNKMKKILGPLDYQSKMLDLYMENFSKKNIALELPTGSGKTLIGLLIGEFRRRKNCEKVLFLCPTNQLVNQVVNQAREKYGINAIAFCGKQREYSPTDKSNYLLGNAVGVTTYSSFFAQHSFFEDVDIIIMDDVHSCEEYVVSNWSVKLNRDSGGFDQLAILLKTIISEADFEHLVSSDNNISAISDWCNLIPMPLLRDRISEISSILSTHIENRTSNYYAYNRIKENLEECNFYISNGSILIRPWIAPTLTVESFESAKQRICMSATLGNSGELERVTGLPNIFKLPIVNNWDKKGLGRKFFVFPDLSLGEDFQGEVVAKLHNLLKKSIVLTPNDNTKNIIVNFFEEESKGTTVYTAKDIEKTKEEFINNNDAVVVLANRFDGIDFPDEESRMLFIVNLPKATNLQERFLITRMGANKLYAERIQTRIIQAVGRCSRNPSDYSLVCIIGDTIQNDLTKIERLRMYPSELRAEIQFGLENSIDYKNVEDILDQAKDFLERNINWQMAEDYIVNLRNSYWEEENNNVKIINAKLQTASNAEVKFQYAMWKKDYKIAYESVSSIVSELNAPSLNGYKSYWNYILGSIAYNLFLQGETDYRLPGIKGFEEALKNNISVKWLSGLATKLFATEIERVVDDYFEDLIIRLEKVFSRFITLNKLEKNIKEIVDRLNSINGKDFEIGHKELGTLLGYISENIDSSGSPDPYWIINSELCIVAEDKIYEKEKEISISHVSEAARHATWIKENVKELSEHAEIITVFICNSNKVDNNARIYAKEIYYLNRTDFINWAIGALNVIRTSYNTFVDAGDSEWRSATHKLFVDNKITPKDYLELVRKKILSDL